MFVFICSPHTIEHRNDMTEDQLIFIWIVTVAILHFKMHVLKGCTFYWVLNKI